jgi:hypothetical protein
MVFLVRSDAHMICRSYMVSYYDYPTEYFVLFHRRIIYHRNIQDVPDRGWSLKSRLAHQYCAVSQPLPEHRGRGDMRPSPAMV